jgi:hypothetical protein
MRANSYWTFLDLFQKAPNRLSCWNDWWDLIGIEPMTSSMPWNDQKRKLLTVK